MQVKDPIYTKLCNVHLRKFIVLSTVVVLASALCCNVKMTENCDESKKKELGNWYKNRHMLIFVY